MAGRDNYLLDPQGRVLAVIPKPGMAMSSYYGSSASARDLASWNPSSGSADADSLGELEPLRARARDLERNHGIARAGIQVHVDSVVGAQLRLQSRPDARLLGWSREQADEWARGVEARWRVFSESRFFDAAERLNFHQMTQLVYRSKLTNGESLALPLWLPRRPAPYATALQLVEADRLSNPYNGPDTDRLRGGLEIDPRGAAVAYHVASRHPGDWYVRGALTWTRIPARTSWGRPRVLHVFDAERPEQRRGVSKLAALLTRFRSLDKYELSELQAAVVNAMTAAVIETPLDGTAIAELFGSPEKFLQTVQELKNDKVRLEGGGRVMQLNPGEKFNSFNPNRPNNAYADFVAAILRHIAAGLNLPYILLLKDFSEVNYSSARAALLEAWRHFLAKRADLGWSWATPVFELWLEEDISRGNTEAPGFYRPELRAAYTRCQWIGAGMGAIDQVKEAQGDAIGLEIGTETLARVWARRGEDWEEMLEQIAREQDKLAILGLTRGDIGGVMASTPMRESE